jgi:hypothetical protein
MPKSDGAKLKKVSVRLSFGIGSAELEADPTERRAAWSLYVELVTRIAVQPLETNQGLLLEALNSLYSLFDTTRDQQLLVKKSQFSDCLESQNIATKKCDSHFGILGVD